MAPSLSFACVADGTYEPYHGRSLSQPPERGPYSGEGRRVTRVLRGLVAGAGTESPLVRVDVGIVPAGQGSPLQNGETLANEHGKLLAWVRELLIGK